MELKKALHTLGIEVLRPFQKEALNTLLTGRNLLPHMRTARKKNPWILSETLLFSSR